jgi:ADP-ribosylation factor related protein 1
MYFKRPEYSILILGLDNAGKTTCLEQIKFMYAPGKSQHEAKFKKDFSRILPTVGLNGKNLLFEFLICP